MFFPVFIAATIRYLIQPPFNMVLVNVIRALKKGNGRRRSLSDDIRAHKEVGTHAKKLSSSKFRLKKNRKN